jgi:hypothetical protein
VTTNWPFNIGNGRLRRLHRPGGLSIDGQFDALGSNRAVYCLDRRGADVLTLQRKTGLATLGWRPADNDRELYFLEHTVAANDVRVAVTLAASRFGMSVEWTDERQLRIRSMRQVVEDPKHLGQRLAVVPDGHFTLAKEGSSQSFALELDRATVEERPFKEKIRALAEWRRTGEYQRVFQSTSLRVLFVVASTKRDPHRLVRIKAWTEAERGESLFWFTELAALTSASVLTQPIWLVAGRREVLPLFYKR